MLFSALILHFISKCTNFQYIYLYYCKKVSRTVLVCFYANRCRSCSYDQNLYTIISFFVSHYLYDHKF